MTMLILKNSVLVDSMLNTLERHMDEIVKDPKYENNYSNVLTILHDFKYLARPETLQFSI